MVKHPLLAPPKAPKPTTTERRLKNLLDGKSTSRKSRGQFKNGAPLVSATTDKTSSASHPTPASAPSVQAVAGIASAPTSRRSSDVFGSIKSGSLDLLARKQGPRPTAKYKQQSPITPKSDTDTENVNGAKNIKQDAPQRASMLKISKASDAKKSLRTSAPPVSKKKFANPKAPPSLMSLPRHKVASPRPKIKPPPPSLYLARGSNGRKEERKSSNSTTPEHGSVEATTNSTKHNPQQPKPSGIASQSSPKEQCCCVTNASTTISLALASRGAKRPRISERFANPNGSKAYDSVRDVPQPGIADDTVGQPTRLQRNNLDTAGANVTNTKKPNAALEEMPKVFNDAAVKESSKTKPKENFVRLNLRNANGACRGGRKSAASRKRKRQDNRNWENGQTQRMRDCPSMTAVAGVDPVDDFVDGAFLQSKKQRRIMQLCKGHQEPCKLLTVKKAGPNKGRQFYACPCPRSEQCSHFQWADDTHEVRTIVLRLIRSRILTTTCVCLLTGRPQGVNEQQVGIRLYCTAGCRLYEKHRLLDSARAHSLGETTRS